MDRLALVLLPENDVRVHLRERTLIWRLLRPPYPAVGIGELRLLRLREGPEGTEMVAGYERYDRLFDRPLQTRTREAVASATGGP